MINVYRGALTYGLEEPWLGALRELATRPESGTFMHRGNYAIVTVGRNYQFPPIRLEFTTAEGVRVRAGKEFVILNFEDTQHIFWRQNNLPEAA
jgi:hypothetical protein